MTSIIEVLKCSLVFRSIVMPNTRYPELLVVTAKVLVLQMVLTFVRIRKVGKDCATLALDKIPRLTPFCWVALMSRCIMFEVIGLINSFFALITRCSLYAPLSLSYKLFDNESKGRHVLFL